jgi:hypothetical protein
VAEVERLRALNVLEILADRVGEIAERPVVGGARRISSRSSIAERSGSA